MTEPLVLYAAPTYRIDAPPCCAAFLGLAEEVWRVRALEAEAEVARLRQLSAVSYQPEKKTRGYYPADS